MLRPESIATPVCLALWIALLAARPVQAQSADWSDRAFFNVNLGYQITARPFDEQLSPVIYAEHALIGVAHPGDGGRLTLDMGGGVHLWRNVGLGGTYTKFATTANSRPASNLFPACRSTTSGSITTRPSRRSSTRSNFVDAPCISRSLL